MRCYKCNVEYSRHHGDLILSNPYIGSYQIVDADYFECERCRNILLPEKTIIKGELEFRKIRDSIIRQFPISEFISSTETANILNITRQALHKHKRIRKGFIYSIKFEGKISYLKKSVYLFQETGDGRFPLRENPIEIPEYDFNDEFFNINYNIVKQKYTYNIPLPEYNTEHVQYQYS